MRGTLVRELNFEKSPADLGGTRRFNGLEDGAFSIVRCSRYNFLKNIIMWLGLFPLYLNVLILYFL